MGRPTTLPSPWADFAEKLHGVGKAAAKLGVTQPTLWKWAHGVFEPAPIMQRHVNAIFRRHGLVGPFGGSR